MKIWQGLDDESCPECGDDLEVMTHAEDGLACDSDNVRCVSCDYASSIAVDEDGSSWLQEQPHD